MNKPAAHPIQPAALRPDHPVPTALTSSMAQLAGLLTLGASLLTGWAQDFRITSATLTNGFVQITFPGRPDSYYFLSAGLSVSTSGLPVVAVLGAAGDLTLTQAVNNSASLFFRIEQIPLASTYSYRRDGIPSGWELQQGLDPLGPSVATNIPPGDTRTWYQIYLDDFAQSQLPLASFPVASSTVIAGLAEADVPVAFSKPFTGRLIYHLSGTAIPNTPSPAGLNGDYFPPAGYVDVSNTTNATIAIQLTPRQAVEDDRSLLIALSVVPTSTNHYAITNLTSYPSIHTLRIVQSLQGIYVGTLSITNGLVLGPQPVKMAIRPGAGTSTVAFFDVTGNPLLGDNFSIPVSYDANQFQLTGGYSTQVTNTPFARPLALNLSFGLTQTNGVLFTVPATMTVSGLTASGLPYTGLGYLNLTRTQ